MTLESIRVHLAPFSIVKKRKTTIAHAFASAIAPIESFDIARCREALAALKLDEADIRCFYCGDMAETWDHVVGLVSLGRFSGYGHVLGNLVPCCKVCNSSKGNSDWRQFLQKKREPFGDFEEKLAVIQGYQAAFGAPGQPYELIRSIAERDIAELESIHSEILALMERADIVAARVRSVVHQTSASTADE